MPNWFYYDNDLQKQGPFNNKKLKELAARGDIVLETLVETEEGQQVKAKDIKGLFPAAGDSAATPKAKPVPVAEPETNNPFANPFTPTEIPDISSQVVPPSSKIITPSVPVQSDIPAAQTVSPEFLEELLDKALKKQQQSAQPSGLGGLLSSKGYDTSQYQYRCVLGPPSVFKYEGYKLEQARKRALDELAQILADLPGSPWEFCYATKIKVIAEERPALGGCLAMLIPGLGQAAKLKKSMTKQAGQLTGTEALGAEAETIAVYIYRKRR
jgi:hypothetical protein